MLGGLPLPPPTCRPAHALGPTQNTLIELKEVMYLGTVHEQSCVSGNQRGMILRAEQHRGKNKVAKQMGNVCQLLLLLVMLRPQLCEG